MEYNYQIQQELENKKFDYPVEEIEPPQQFEPPDEAELRWQRFQEIEKQKRALLPNYYATEYQQSYNKRGSNNEKWTKKQKQNCCFIIIFIIALIIMILIQHKCECLYGDEDENDEY